MANKLQAEGLVFGEKLQAVGLGLPPALPANFDFSGKVCFILQKGPAFFQLPFEDVVQQGAVGTASREMIERNLLRFCK